MPKQPISFLIPALILAVTFPGAAALMYYKLTGDPTMQPLDITLSKLAERNSTGQTSGILIEMDWGRSAKSPNSREEVKFALQKSMSVYGIEYLVRIRDTQGSAIQVYFVSGSNRIGPYRLSNVASGIGPALAAFHMAENEKR